MAQENLQPTKEMLDAGVKELRENLPYIDDYLDEHGMEESELEDIVCFIYQAMRMKKDK